MLLAFLNFCIEFVLFCVKQVARHILNKIEDGLIDPNTMTSGQNIKSAAAAQDDVDAAGCSC